MPDCRATKAYGSIQGCGLATRHAPPSGAMGGGPPGSAGVPPASSPFAAATDHPAGGNRMGPAESSPGSRRWPGCAKTCAGGTPALPGGLYDIVNQRRSIPLRVYSCSFMVRLQQSCSPCIHVQCLENSVLPDRVLVPDRRDSSLAGQAPGCRTQTTTATPQPSGRPLDPGLPVQ